jgi:hypothetical protein
MHHVYLERMVFAIDVMFRWCVHVELHKLEILFSNGCGAIHDDFNRRPQVFKLDFLFWDVHGGLLGSYCD